ncbi:MAG: RNA methyltransferase, TrmH family [uncultured Nocardioidaceae bacterium]|uniref:RNA methyltransferase, TrmH family n=1 Tax=uncultured Nocardioidaceae bacterium TaxID=253824 RepID=A0A6J4MPT8_9ACTN|nr:MAG: RNA methyltransferase, TrmH family [uncultured Nocardioidaceae bacterium]
MKAARQLTRRATRAERRLFLAEGRQAVGQALAGSGGVAEIYALAEVERSSPDLRATARGQDVPWHVVDEPALRSLADTVHPQGLVAVCPFLDHPLADLLGADTRLLVICADVRDPGNAGTVIRCADAAGADGVVLAGSSVDPYNGKAVRASAGSLFHVPLTVHGDISEVVSSLRSLGMHLLAADSHGETDLDDAADSGLLSRPSAWVFGNEAWGLPDEVARLADHRVSIPIYGRAESLNLATAAAVCLYASARAQRRPSSTGPA